MYTYGTGPSIAQWLYFGHLTPQIVAMFGAPHLLRSAHCAPIHTQPCDGASGRGGVFVVQDSLYVYSRYIDFKCSMLRSSGDSFTTERSSYTSFVLLQATCCGRHYSSVKNIDFGFFTGLRR
ncbi:unnamed protein product [Ectocarpus fasciculatus]